MTLDAEMVRSHDFVYRIYTWDSAWVSLGKFQRPETALKTGCAVPRVMRPTGGRAVLHGHDLTIAFFVPTRMLNALGFDQRSVKQIYRWAMNPLVLALRDAGIEANLGDSQRSQNHKSNQSDCFLAISGSDVFDQASGKKVCGSALAVTDAGALIQASIPISKPLVDPSTVFDFPAPPSFVAVKRELLAQKCGYYLEELVNLQRVNPS